MKPAPIVLGSILLAACATATPPDLRDARVAYDRASHGVAADLAPADLHVAGEQLKEAEMSFHDEGDTYRTRALAYAAQRKAELAQVRGDIVASRDAHRTAQAQLDALRREQVSLTAARLTAAQLEIARIKHQLELTQQKLASVGTVRAEARGTVITIPGSVLFATDKYDLLPQALVKLNDIASVLVNDAPDTRISVEGYTDSRGSDEHNLQLAKNRADAVRTYLVARGVDPSRISAEGFGPASPRSENATPEGRAENRRVEIVVQPKAARERR